MMIPRFCLRTPFCDVYDQAGNCSRYYNDTRYFDLAGADFNKSVSMLDTFVEFVGLVLDSRDAYCQSMLEKSVCLFTLPPCLNGK